MRNMGMVKQFNKGKVNPSPLDPKLMAAWNQGYNQGVKQQREADINHLVKLLEGLEMIPGIGEKRSWQIREHFLRKFES